MTLQELNKKRWDNCHVYSARGPLFEKTANRIKANKPIYDKIEKATGVPWWFVGITHYRESNLNLETQLAQGDPLHTISHHVPKGRGPFKTFEEGAYDALVNCAPYAAKNKDWSVGSALTMFEKYNGLGYANMGRPSPYVWAGTDQYVSGKYTSDGHYNPGSVDTQLGCAGLMKYLGVGKPDIKGPIAATSLGTGSLFYALWDQVLAHPYIAVGASVALAGLIAYGIHKYRNRKIKHAETQEPLPEHVDEGNRLGRTDLE